MWDERAKAAIDRSRNGSTGSAIMAQLLAAANIFQQTCPGHSSFQTPSEASTERLSPGRQGLVPGFRTAAFKDRSRKPLWSPCHHDGTANIVFFQVWRQATESSAYERDPENRHVVSYPSQGRLVDRRHCFYGQRGDHLVGLLSPDV